MEKDTPLLFTRGLKWCREECSVRELHDEINYQYY
jgi:hypothetical protein